MKFHVATAILLGLYSLSGEAGSFDVKARTSLEALRRGSENEHVALFSRVEGSATSLDLENFTAAHPLFCSVFVEGEFNAEDETSYANLRRFGLRTGWKSAFELFAGEDVLIWGKGDELNPTDLVNAESFLDFIVFNKDRRKIPRPMGTAKLTLLETNLTLVAMPTIQRHDLPDPKISPWCQGDCKSINPAQIEKSYAEKGVAADVSDLDLSERRSEIDLPARYDALGDSWEYAARLDRSFSAFDIAFVYHYGADRYPVYRRTFLSPTSLKMQEINAERPAYGGDLSFTLGPVALRGEALVKEKKAFMLDPRGNKFQTDDDGLLYDREFEYLVGIDSDIFWGLFVSAQYFERQNDLDYLYVLTPSGSKLASGLIRRTFFADDLTLEYRILYDIEGDSSAQFPTVRYRIFESLEAMVQVNFFYGSDGTLFGDHSDNSGALGAMTLTL